MKKEYLVMITRGNGIKENAIKRYNQIFNSNSKRYASTLEEAQKALNYCLNEYTLKEVGKTTTIDVKGLGISHTLDKGTYEALKVVDSYIKVREVTEWEEV